MMTTEGRRRHLRAEGSRLTPGLDFYNEYIWTARGGTQEVKHTYTTSYDEVYNTTSGNTNAPAT